MSRIDQLHRCRPGRTAMLVIDMQRGFLEPGAALEVPQGREVVPNVRRLIDVCRTKGVPVIFTEFVYSTAVPLRRAWVNASYAGFLPDDMVHNSDRFGSAYQGSTNVRSNITNGYRFTLLRDGGWPGTPAITVHAVDTLGAGDEP